MSSLNDDLRKLAIAGIGAASLAAEKAGEAVELLSKRGEGVVAQGREMGGQLKHDLKETIRESVTVVNTVPDLDGVLGALDTFTPQQRAAVEKKLQTLREQADDRADDE